jgi:hypothetical protein
MLQICLIVRRHLSSFKARRSFSTFMSVRSDYGRSESLKPQPKQDHFWKVNIIQRFISHKWPNKKRFLKHFVRLKFCFLNVKTKLDASSLLLMVWHFTRLQTSQNALKITHNGKSHTKQLSVTATLTTLIHNKLTQRYLAACSRVISSWLSTRLVRELLSRKSYKNASKCSTNAAPTSNQFNQPE